MIGARDVAIMLAGGLAIGLVAAQVAGGVGDRGDRASSQRALERIMAPDPQLQAEYEASRRELRRLELLEAAGAGSVSSPVAIVGPEAGDGTPAYLPAAPQPMVAVPVRNIAVPGVSMHSSSRRETPYGQAQVGGDQSYLGISGARYRYDLGRPIDRMRYDNDPMTQLQDSISIDPRRDIDRSIGQDGGGIER